MNYSSLDRWVEDLTRFPALSELQQIRDLQKNHGRRHSQVTTDEPYETRLTRRLRRLRQIEDCLEIVDLFIINQGKIDTPLLLF